MGKSIYYLPAPYTAVIHSLIACLGLLFPLYVGLASHSSALLVTHCGPNHYEFWPSISTTIGDMQPERQLWRSALVISMPFRVLCIISVFYVFWVKGARGLQGFQHIWRGGVFSLPQNSAVLVILMVFFDATRCVPAFVWTLVSSTEKLEMHNAGFILYIILSECFHLSCTLLTWRNQRNASIYEEPWHAAYSFRTKCMCIAGQTISLTLMAFFYSIHRQTCWNGSYSATSIFEWGFAFFNLLFDATLAFDLKNEGWAFGEWSSFRNSLRVLQRKGTSSSSLPTKLMDDKELKHFDNLDEREHGLGDSEDVSPNSHRFSETQVHVITIVSPPSDYMMWVCDIFWAYQYFGSLVHSFQHVYYQPMVEMEFTKEVLATFSFFSPALLMIPCLRKILTGGIPGSYRFVSWSKASTSSVPMYVLFYFIVTLSHLQQLVTKNSNLKILSTGIAPFFLPLALVLRFLYPTAARSETEEVQECRRMCYTLPLGLVFAMIFRILYVSQDPLYTNPFYGCVFGIAGGLFFTLTVYRHALFSAHHEVKEWNESLSPSELGSDFHKNSFLALVKSYRSISSFWLGVLYGALVAFGLLFLVSPNIIPRCVAIDPFPASVCVVLFFLSGIILSSSLLPIMSTADGTVGRTSFLDRIRGIQKFIPAIFLVSFLVFTVLMLYGTKQSNFSYSSHHYTYHEPNGSIKDWKVQESFAGNKHFAFLCGLGMVFCAGVLFPVAMEITWVQKRYRSSLFTRAEDIRVSDSRTKFSPLTFEFVSSFVLFAFVLSFVMCLCYPFVPLGEIFREGTRGCILILVSLIAFSLFICVTRTRRITLELHSYQNIAAHRHLPLGVVMMVLGTFLCVLFGRFLLRPDSRGFPNRDPGFAATYQPYILCMYDKLMEVSAMANGLTDDALSRGSRANLEYSASDMMSSLRNRLLHGECTQYKSRNLLPLSDKMNEKVLEVATGLYEFSGLIWTIHFGLDNYNADSLENMVTAIASTGASVVGILESDLSHIHNGNRDVAEFLSYHLGFPYVDNGPVPLDNTFGCALISRYPILKIHRYILPSPLGELACTIHATLDVMGVHIETYVGHFGNTQHVADGLLQSQFLGQLVRSTPGPSMWLGYLVTYPGNKVKYAEYSDPVKPGYFRDAAHTLYTQRSWVRLWDRGGYDEIPPPSDRVIPEEEFTDFNLEAKIGVAAYLEKGLSHIDESFRDAPSGKQKRTFLFNETNRYTHYHPRYEFLDRYCEYILYKTGKKKDELPEHWNKLQLYAVEAYDWMRVQDNAFIDSLSDTGIQLLKLRFVEQEEP